MDKKPARRFINNYQNIQLQKIVNTDNNGNN